MSTFVSAEFRTQLPTTKASHLFASDPQIKSPQDVMVTGIGLVTPLGIGREITWKRLLAGDRAGRALTEDDIDHYDQLAALLERAPGGAPVNQRALSETAARCSILGGSESHDLLNQIIAVSFAEAIDDAALALEDLANSRTGVVVGTSKPSLRALETEFRNRFVQSESELDLWQSGFMPDAPLRTILNLTRSIGPSSCPVAACASGLFSVIEGAAWIQSGMCDVCIVGSADASLRASVLASFHRLGVTSGQPEAMTACRPFDRDRDGFIIGEGAGVMILESRAHAAARSARAYARLTSGRSLTGYDWASRKSIKTAARLWTCCVCLTLARLMPSVFTAPAQKQTIWPKLTAWR